MPRLVQKGGCRLESYLRRYSHDLRASGIRPAFIGKVGSIFGQHRVNIAQMVGRSPVGGQTGWRPPLASLSARLGSARRGLGGGGRAPSKSKQAWIVKLPAAGELPPGWPSSFVVDFPFLTASVSVVHGARRLSCRRMGWVLRLIFRRATQLADREAAKRPAHHPSQTLLRPGQTTTHHSP